MSHFFLSLVHFSATRGIDRAHGSCLHLFWIILQLESIRVFVCCIPGNLDQVLVETFASVRSSIPSIIRGKKVLQRGLLLDRLGAED